MTHPATAHLRNALYGRLWPLLIAVVVLNFGYPILSMAGGFGDLIYIAAYALMLVLGIFVTGNDRVHVIRAGAFAMLWFVLSLLVAAHPGNAALRIAQLAALLPGLAIIIASLARFIVEARVVNGQVLISAITIYVLLAVFFAPVYGLIETLAPGSFVDNGLGRPVQWQQLMYYSTVTLTTVGYGDILPLNPWARTLAALESVTGVLYIAVLLGRLVGIYRQEK